MMISVIIASFFVFQRMVSLWIVRFLDKIHVGTHAYNLLAQLNVQNLVRTYATNVNPNAPML